MNTSEPLFQVSPEANFLVLHADASAAANLESQWDDSGLSVRHVRGKKMRSLRALFDEFAAALQFPYYFGENPNAFNECVRDLSWLRPRSGYVLVITDPEEVLVDSDRKDDLDWLVRTLVRAQGEWAAAVEKGEWWDRPPVPFHVVLQFRGDDSTYGLRHWTAAGAEMVPLPI